MTLYSPDAAQRETMRCRAGVHFSSAAVGPGSAEQRFTLRRVRNTRHSFPHPFRRTLFRKRLRALDIVLRGRHRLHGGIFALRRSSPAPARPQGPSGSPAWRHGSTSGCSCRSVSAQRSAAASASPGRHHLIDEAEFQTLPRRDVPAGQDHAHGPLQPDLARQPVQATGQRRQADARLGQREGRVLGGNDEVAGQRDLEAAAHGDAVDGGDDRLVAVEARGQPGETRRSPSRACRPPPAISGRCRRRTPYRRRR